MGIQYIFFLNFFFSLFHAETPEPVHQLSYRGQGRLTSSGEHEEDEEHEDDETRAIDCKPRKSGEKKHN